MKTDSQIQSDVLEELKWDPSITHEHIGVSVADSIVTLSGSVPTYVEKSAAELATQRVAGVKAVVEKIQIKLPGSLKKDDESIARAIISQFKWNVQVPEDQIKASVENGWVELTGEVEWDYQRTAAVNCVKGLSGVVGVSNSIVLKHKDIEANVVKQKIEKALTREAERDAKRIAVEVRGDKVILSGSVRSFAEIQDAKLAAWSAPGVANVESKLNVVNYF